MSDRAAPYFSIITPVYNPPVDVLAETIQSVIDQRWADWELILVDDKSSDPEVLTTLRRYSARDDRIRLIERSANGHIVAASNDGIDAARGEFIGLLDHDDLLARRALARVARRLEDRPDTDYLYTDEDKVDAKGRFYDAFAKPDWSPERLRWQNYCSHFSVMRTQLVRDVGGFREGFDGAQDHDLVLRVTEKARHVEHLSAVLYHWRAVAGSTAGEGDAKPYAFESGRRAVQEHLERTGVRAEVSVGGVGRYVLSRQLPPERRVSIVIPTIGSVGTLWGRPEVMVLRAVESALGQTEHDNLEIVVVADEPTPGSVIEQLRGIAGAKLRVVWFREPFNYSRKVNFGVLASTGDRIITLNDDTEVRSERWVEELLAPLEEPSVGMTGGKLYYSSDTIQHAGLAFSRGHYLHPFRTFPRESLGPFNTLAINREVSGVTGACVGIRRETFLEVGGLTEELPHSFNDVDFSYKVDAAGYRILFVPACELFHFETMTRKSPVQSWEIEVMHRRWGRPTRDPYLPEFPNMPETAVQKRERATRAARRRKHAEL